jgi:signal transduction histidine kinase
VGLTLRAFVALLAAALPPVVAFLILGSGALGTLDPGGIVLVGIGALAVTIGWTAIIAVLVSRVIGQELGELLELAERGGPRPASPSSTATETAELDARSRRLTETLDERNRQVAELAAKANAAPISDDPRLVAGHVVDTVRSVTGDPTWLLAILDSSDPDRLVTGIYEGGVEEPGPATELHRWAATAGDPVDGHVRRVDGPWGAFVIVDVAAHEGLRAILLAPWEGRADASAAELDLLSLVGQHAATAIEHALLYATVRHQADALDRMGAVQRDFLRAVSHDLQTPLASIRALAGELRSRPPLDADSAADLDLIEHQADRLRRMVQQLLAMSRLEAGVLAPQPEVVSARPLIERTWAALRAPDRRLELRVERPQLLLVADPDRLEQALWAILDNAVKYSPAGSPIGVTLGAVDPTGQRAVIAVHDDGQGMDPETTERAFEQFYRSEPARRIAPDGSGIGLYTARGLVEAMGGSVRISSAVGRGTTIILELPAEPVEEREPAEVRP